MCLVACHSTSLDDLSHLVLNDLDVLAGAIWSTDTVWPPDMTKRVKAAPQELSPGIYQVRGGSECDSAGITSR
jgi:hypothetical protein